MPTILIVDDTLFMRVAIGNMVKNWGFEVVGEAANGQEAVQLYEQLQPDIVTMDLTMPVMNGLDAVKKIIAKNPNAKIIMVTALGQPRIMVDAIENGAKDFITKPFTPEKLKSVLYQALNLVEDSSM
ncbi:response regulator [Solibacillus sp. FSL K6-1523]|uniref:response regulator n=1 Tax=Solibacillus sp. FSL K6-1523 TaxID=2921471 RepID=UPI0030F8B7EE